MWGTALSPPSEFQQAVWQQSLTCKTLGNKELATKIVFRRLILSYFRRRLPDAAHLSREETSLPVRKSSPGADRRYSRSSVDIVAWGVAERQWGLHFQRAPGAAGSNAGPRRFSTKPPGSHAVAQRL